MNRNNVGYMIILTVFLANIAIFYFASSSEVRLLSISQALVLFGLGLFYRWLLQKEQKDIRNRDEFIGIASHELKTPLTAIVMQLGLVKRTALSPQQIQIIDLATDASIKMTRLVETLLDSTKVKLGRIGIFKRTIDLVPVIKNCVDHPERNIKFNIPDQIVGQFDPERLCQVIENLVSNAVKYGRGSAIHIDAVVTKNSVIITITDKGIGISKKDQKRIFQNMERGVDDRFGITGMGIGLFVAQQITEAHGGTLTVHSEKNLGSSFMISLPMK